MPFLREGTTYITQESVNAEECTYLSLEGEPYFRPISEVKERGLVFEL